MLICTEISSELTDVAMLESNYWVYNSETRKTVMYNSDDMLDLLRKQDVKYLKRITNKELELEEIISDSVFFSDTPNLEVQTIDDIDVIFSRVETLIIYKGKVYTAQTIIGTAVRVVEPLDKNNVNIVIESTHFLIWVIKKGDKLDIRIFHSVIFIVSRYRLTADFYNTEVMIPRTFTVKEQVDSLLFKIENAFTKREFLYNSDTNKYMSLSGKNLLSDEESYIRYLETGFKIHVPVLKPYLDTINNTISDKLEYTLRLQYFRKYFWRREGLIRQVENVSTILSMLLSYEYRNELSVIEDIIGVTGVVLQIQIVFEGTYVVMKCCPMIQVNTYSYDLEPDDFGYEIAKYYYKDLYLKKVEQENET